MEEKAATSLPATGGWKVITNSSNAGEEKGLFQLLGRRCPRQVGPGRFSPDCTALIRQDGSATRYGFAKKAVVGSEGGWQQQPTGLSRAERRGIIQAPGLDP